MAVCFKVWNFRYSFSKFVAKDIFNNFKHKWKWELTTPHSLWERRVKLESWKHRAGFHSSGYSLLIGKKYIFVDLKLSVCEVE